MVVAYEESKVMFKDNPDIWHALPVTKKGLMMIPLTKEACDRHNLAPHAPHSIKRQNSRRNNKHKGQAEICTAEDCDCR